MTLFEPALDGTGIYSTGVGKDSPYGKQTGLFKPKLFRGGGRFGAIGTAINTAGRYFRKNPRFAARIGAVAGGAAVRYASQNARSNSKYQTLRSTNKYKRSFRSRTSVQCCCRPCQHNSTNRY